MIPRSARQVLARHGVVHAPGGQLMQATDQWIGVRRARSVVLDTEGVRAPVVASWLRRMGHEACGSRGRAGALAGLSPRPRQMAPVSPDLARIAARIAPAES